jgi:hypothetical protein
MDTFASKKAYEKKRPVGKSDQNGHGKRQYYTFRNSR